MSKKEMGVVVAPPGSGKTMMALMIVDKQQPSLIIVHRKQLAQQWMERIEAGRTWWPEGRVPGERR